MLIIKYLKFEKPDITKRYLELIALRYSRGGPRGASLLQIFCNVTKLNFNHLKANGFFYKLLDNKNVYQSLVIFMIYDNVDIGIDYRAGSSNRYKFYQGIKPG